MKKQKLFFLVAGYLVLFLGILLVIYKSDFQVSDLSSETIKTIANNNTILVLIIMLALMALQNLFSFIPLILVITINIALFGFWEGYLYSCLCSVVGSTIIFLSIRYVFPNIFTSARFEKYQKKVEKNGFLFVLSGRVFPFLPTNLINIISGLSSMKLSHFVLGTTLGNMIYGFILASVSLGFLTISNQNYLIFILIIIILLAFSIVTVLKKQREPKTY